jgi:hypothetical protein
MFTLRVFEEEIRQYTAFYPAIFPYSCQLSVLIQPHICVKTAQISLLPASQTGRGKAQKTK